MTAAPPPNGWLLQVWGEEAVAYDTASGDTHYLRPQTLALYQFCRSHPGLTASEIASALAIEQRTPEDSRFAEEIDEGLNSLRRIGLLRTP